MRIPIPFSGRTFFWWFGGIFLFVGLGLVYGGIRDATQERTYRTQGQAVEAVVVGKSIQRASREGNSSTKYEIAYRFTTADGRTAEGVDAVTVEEWERLDPGSPFTVTYLPGAPETSRAQRSGEMASALGLIGLGGLLTVIGGGVLVRTATHLWRELRLLHEGMTAQGTVFAIEPSSVAVNRIRQWNVRYRYKDHFGRPQEGKSGPVPPAAVEAVAVGDTVEVRFDRARPEESVWVGPRDVPGAQEGMAGSSRQRRPSFWKALRNIAVTLGVLFAAVVVGESVPALKALDRLAARHEFVLSAVMIGMTVVGFVLFMGGILYRIFGGDSAPMSQEEVEDVARGVGLNARPVASRVSAYRFRGASAGASFSDEFTLKEAKKAWRQRAWRTSPRWRSNFIVTAGALSFTVGLFGFFVIGGPAGIKLLFLAAIVSAVIGTVVRWARA
jgi:Protein of unknown function (DUF3592)